MSTFFTETLTRALPGLIDSNDTRANATAADMAVDKKGHTRHTDTICSRTGGRGGSAGRREVDFCWLRDRTGQPNVAQTNIANKLPIQFSYAENAATSFPLRDLPASSLVRLRSRVLVLRRRKLAPARRVDLSSHLSRLVPFPSQSKLPPCSFGNGRVKCKYRRFGSLRTLVFSPPVENYVGIPRRGTPFDDEEGGRALSL